MSQDNVIEMLKAVSVSTLTTCLFRRGLRRRVIAGALPLRPGTSTMVGPAFTLRFIPAREDIDIMETYQLATNVHRRAIEECPVGAVLVIDAGGDLSGASGGDIMVARLKARGVAGIVTDGGFRDTGDIARLEFPAFHRAPAPSSSPIGLHPLDLNQPIGCGGVAVYPGDMVVGNADGVVVIPHHLALDVALEAQAMTEYEDFAAAEVARGRSLFEVYPATPQSHAEFLAAKGAGTSCALK